MEGLLREFDWSNNPLGPLENWPMSLKLFVSLILPNTLPCAILWGPELILIPNEPGVFHPNNKNGKLENLGKRARDFYSRIWSQFEPIINSVRYEGKSFFGEDYPTRDLSWDESPISYWSMNLSPLRNEFGQIKGILMTAYDTTEKVLNFQGLRETQNRLELALDAVKMGTYEYRVAIDEFIPSDRFLEITGAKRGISRSEMRNTIFEEDRIIRDQAYHKALHTGILLYEVRLQKDPSQWIRIEGKAYFNEKGEAEKMVGTILDISDKKKSEERILESTKKLAIALEEQRDLQRQKDEFLQIASHELRTPLTSIKGFGQLVEEILLENQLFNESQMVEKLNQKIDQLQKLVENLFDVSKLNSGKLFFEDSVFDLVDLLKSNVEDVRYSPTQHFFKEEYPFKGKVIADRDRISQVIMNLLTNAIKYSPPGSEITIRSRKQGNFMVVDIQDKGIGIPDSEQEKIFSQFFQSEFLSSQKFKGIGLGLYIASQIIHRQGGRIWVESTLGKGSTFSFSLPLFFYYAP